MWLDFDCFLLLSTYIDIIFLSVVSDLIAEITAEIEDIPSIISEVLNFSVSFCIKISISIIIVKKES